MKVPFVVHEVWAMLRQNVAAGMPVVNCRMLKCGLANRESRVPVLLNEALPVYRVLQEVEWMAPQ